MRARLRHGVEHVLDTRYLPGMQLYMEDHAVPRVRRDFAARGLVSLSGRKTTRASARARNDRSMTAPTCQRGGTS